MSHTVCLSTTDNARPGIVCPTAAGAKSSWVQYPVLWQMWQNSDCVHTCSGVNFYCMVIVPDGDVPDGNLALMNMEPCAAHAYFTVLSSIDKTNTLSLFFLRWQWRLNYQHFLFQTVSASFFVSDRLNVSSIFLLPNKLFYPPFLCSLRHGGKQHCLRGKACAVIMLP